MGRRRGTIMMASALLALGAGGSAASAATRTISFSGLEWTVKAGSTAIGPGPNFFSASPSNVWVDKGGRLHLKITRSQGRWWSAEVIGTRSLGHGTYTWTLDSRVDALDPNVVLGLFTWSDSPAFANREIDIEFSRWGNPLATANGQFVVQPHSAAGHLQPFRQLPVARSQHGFTWVPGSVAFASVGGSVPAWSYLGADVPPAGDERPRMNLWLNGGAAPTDGRPVEVILSAFRFTPTRS